MMKNNERSYRKYSRFFLFVLLLASSQYAAAQQKDPAKPVKDSVSPAHLYHAEVHVGIGSQKAVFGGYRLAIDPLFFGIDFGYQAYLSDKNYTFSATIGWAPPATRTEPGFVYSVIFSNHWKEFFSNSSAASFSILTANIGWLSQHQPGLSYALNLGAGIKMTSSALNPGDDKVLREPRPFINLEGSVGFAFF